MHFSGAHLRKVTTRTVVACNTKYIGTSRSLESKRLVAYNEPSQRHSVQKLSVQPAFQVSRYLTRFIVVAINLFCGCFVRHSSVIPCLPLFGHGMEVNTSDHRLISGKLHINFGEIGSTWNEDVS